MKPLMLSTPHRDRLLLLGWAGLLLATAFLHPSLMAHDEGNFAAETRFMVESGRWLSRRWWGEPVYTHGVLLNWLMAVSYEIFGIGARAARLPSAIACLIAVLLTYDISRIVTGKRILGFLSAALLMLFHLWFQFGHLATQDMLLVCLELFGIWGLLQAEAQPKRRLLWGFLSGLVLGLGFLTKSFMILLSAAALFPYLLFEQRRHRHLTNPGLYLGLLTGVGLVGLWLWLSIAQYGDVVTDSLFGKITELGEKPFHADAGKFYYLWNIPANAFPWPLFSIIGAWFCWRDERHAKERKEVKSPYRWLLIYPFILAGMLTSFSTRTPYYTLQLHPFLAMFAAIALHRIATQPVQWPRQCLSWAFGALGLIAVAIGLLAFLPAAPDWLSEVRAYAPIALVLGLGWMCLPLTMASAGQFAGRWLAAWLLPVWLALGVVGITGLLGDYSPELRADLARSPTAEIIATEPIDFLTGNDWADTESHKTLVLLSFYTPKLGQLNPSEKAPEQTPEQTPATYAWLAPNADSAAIQREHPYETIAQVEQWQLIRFRQPS
jgi:4-amino-4-deoxy-L-arabinose transferase-like glycosyltransferase